MWFWNNVRPDLCHLLWWFHWFLWIRGGRNEPVDEKYGCSRGGYDCSCSVHACVKITWIYLLDSENKIGFKVARNYFFSQREDQQSKWSKKNCKHLYVGMLRSQKKRSCRAWCSALWYQCVKVCPSWLNPDVGIIKQTFTSRLTSTCEKAEGDPTCRHVVAENTSQTVKAINHHWIPAGWQNKEKAGKRGNIQKTLHTGADEEQVCRGGGWSADEYNRWADEEQLDLDWEDISVESAGRRINPPELHSPPQLLDDEYTGVVTGDADRADSLWVSDVLSMWPD